MEETSREVTRKELVLIQGLTTPIYYLSFLISGCIEGKAALIHFLQMLFLLRAVVFAEHPKVVSWAFTGCNGLSDPVITGVLYLLSAESCPFVLPLSSPSNTTNRWSEIFHPFKSFMFFTSHQACLSFSAPSPHLRFSFQEIS